MPIPGRPEVLLVAAEALARAADGLDDVHHGLDPAVRAALTGWRGTATTTAAVRADADLGALLRASQACRAVVPALRRHAEDLARAQRDIADGEQLAGAAAAALVPRALSGPDTAAASADLETGARIVESAQQAVALAAEDAARVVREAAALLPDPVDAERGNLLDGLRKAGGDLVDELGSTARGAFDRVNVFSDRFGEAWSETGATVAAIATDPMGALGAIGESVTAPIAESYRTGGVDEAAARGAGTIAAALLGGKGLTKLGKLVPDAPPTPVGPLPAMRRVPGGGLRGHENLGGHALDPGKAHVGASDRSMEDRLSREPGRKRVSSYTNRLVAERAAHDNLGGNAGAIETWLQDPTQVRPRGFRWEHDHVVGRTASRDGTVADTVTSTTVLKKDARSPLGYYILSSYPGE